MSTHKAFDKICVAVIVLSLIITVLFMNGERLGVQVIADEDAEGYVGNSYFTANDQNGTWDSSKATVITLDGEEGKVSGSGAYAYDGGITITQSGYYKISGTLSDGSITVAAEDFSKVWILLDGVDIACSDDACIRVDQADKVFLTLAEGSENTLASGETYSEEALEDGTGGTIFAHDDLTINGSGSLSITAAYKHGIDANDDLVITGGDISITAVKDGIHANDSFRFMNADLTVEAEDDGIAVANDDGYLYMQSGTIRITAADDAVHTGGDVTVDGGELTISAGDDGVHSDTMITVNAGTILVEECYEGLEAIVVEIYGGDVTIYASDDGINANGGTSSFGQPGMNMENMGSTEHMDGTEHTGMGGPGGMNMGVFGEDSSEALPEGTAGGEMLQEAGTEATGTAGGETRNGQEMNPGSTGTEAGNTDNAGMGQAGAGMGDTLQNTMENSSGEGTSDTGDASEEEETYILIAGGTVTIINDNGMDADGLDSNGSVYITGGDVRVSLTNSGTNSAVDYGSESGGVAQISGGTLVACGSSGMAEAFDTDSEQCSIMYNISAGIEAGETILLEDADGNVLISYEVPCSFSSAIVSCPEMQLGESYTVVIGDDAETITIEEMSAAYGDAQSSMFGGTMNFGGMQPRQQGGASAPEGGEWEGETGGFTPVEGGEYPDMTEMGGQMQGPQNMEGENGQMQGPQGMGDGNGQMHGPPEMRGGNGQMQGPQNMEDQSGQTQERSNAAVQAGEDARENAEPQETLAEGETENSEGQAADMQQGGMQQSDLQQGDMQQSGMEQGGMQQSGMQQGDKQQGGMPGGDFGQERSEADEDETEIAEKTVDPLTAGALTGGSVLILLIGIFVAARIRSKSVFS